MITLKAYKKSIRMAVCYSASLVTLKRMARTYKVKHVPARSKLRIAKAVRQSVKDATYGMRYSSGKVSGNAANIVHSDLSNLELRILANMPNNGGWYLTH